VTDTEATRLFRVLGDPTRLKLLSVLREGEADVTRLGGVIGRPPSVVSSHLRYLRLARAVTCRRVGRNVVYRLEDAARQLLHLLEDDMPLPPRPA
jgi:ArsR family transcriptional regulator